MKQIYDWDTAKAQINLAKHKVGFDEAETVFDDPFLLTYSDKLHSEKEDRFIKYWYVRKIATLIGCPRRKNGNHGVYTDSYYQLS